MNNDDNQKICNLYTSLCLFNAFTSGFLDMEFRKLEEALMAAGVYRQKNKRAMNAIREHCRKFTTLATRHRMEMKAMRAVAGYWVDDYIRQTGREMLEGLSARAYDNVRGEWTAFAATVSNFLHRVMKDESEETKEVARRIMHVNGIANITLTANVVFANEVQALMARSGMAINHGETAAMKGIIRMTGELSTMNLRHVDYDPKLFEPCQQTLQRLSEVLFDKNETQCNTSFAESEMQYILQYAVRATEEYRTRGFLPERVREEVFGVMGNRWMLLLKEWKTMSKAEWPEETDMRDKTDELTIMVAAQDKAARWTKEFIDNVIKKIRNYHAGNC